MRERMRDVRVAAISEGVVVASTISIPELLQPLFGEEIDCYRHVGNGTRFVLTTALPFMPHEFAGVDADITDLAA